MRLPGCQDAIVDIRKLSEYCLNPDHPQGKYKAYVFEAVLGVTITDAEALREKLLQIVCDESAIEGEHDKYGRRYVIDFELEWTKGAAIIRSAWIIRRDENFPRLTSCYVL
ncbi:MAG: hypothetical protein D6737_01435 [Chloroflexi bacterium]|nr:MAG: hypothetical protein D6737_01435 [Chloroflexota bacterium]